MYEITTEIDIKTTAEAVWNTLVDFAAYPQWNPFIRNIAGSYRCGERLKVSVQPKPHKTMTFRPTVLTAAPCQELRWRGHLLLPGIFDGEHYFRIESKTTDSIRFIHGEKFSGVLLPFLRSDLEIGTRQGFETMNNALKSRLEQSS